MRKPRIEKGQVNVRLPVVTIDGITEEAEKRGRNFSQQLRFMLEYYLANCEESVSKNAK